MVGAILLASVWPELGASDGLLPMKQIKQLGVFLVFFNQGVQLPGEELRRGLKNWRLHGLVQVATYILFPILTVLALGASASAFQQEDLRNGFLYLAFLPTTVTSAVALTSVAGGNVTGALFNCTLSSVLGVFLVPVLCVQFIGVHGGGADVSMGPMLLNVALTILVPLILGQIFRSRLQAVYSRHKPFFRRFNNGVILLIVYTAFCNSFQRNIWSSVSTVDLIITAVGVLGILGIMHASVWWASGATGLDPASRITALYCGGQKSLAVGLPMSAMVFGSSATVELSLLLLPLLMYHPAQLVLGGWFSSRSLDGVVTGR